jgi:hypothetical protein
MQPVKFIAACTTESPVYLSRTLSRELGIKNFNTNDNIQEYGEDSTRK